MEGEIIIKSSVHRVLTDIQIPGIKNNLTLFDSLSLGNGLETEGDLMQINIYQIILNEV